MPLQYLPRALVLLPLLLVLNLVACGTTSPPPVKPPANPLPPAIGTSLPQQDYSTTAAQDIQNWRKQLKATPTM